MHGEKQDALSRQFIGFKTRGSCKATIQKNLLQAIKEIDRNADIIVLPGSKPALNQMQKTLENQSIQRISQAITRTVRAISEYQAYSVKRVCDAGDVKSSPAILTEAQDGD